MDDLLPKTAGREAEIPPSGPPAPLPLVRRADFRLGAATVRPSVRTVEGPAGSGMAEPRVMQVLLALVDAGGSVLSREDLLRICWNGRLVGDDAINRAIAEVRRIAQATAAGFGVETIPRIGYRLKVDAAETAPSAADAAPEMPQTPATGVNRRLLLAGGGAAAVLALGGIGWWATRPAAPGSRLIEEIRIALRAGSPAADRQAIAMLERAVAATPGDAEAWGLLALTRARIDEHAAPDAAVSPAAMVDRAAHRALAIDKDNADAKGALAIAVPYYGDWLAAERRFDAVLAEHPDHVATTASRAFLLAAVGRIREGAQARVDFAGDVSFEADFQYGLIYAHWFLGRIEEADRVASRAMEMWPRHASIWFGRLWVLAGTGRFDRALAQIEDVAARPPMPPPMFETLRTAMAAARSRKPEDVAAAAQQVLARAGANVASVVNGMMLLNLMGAIDAAFVLARAYYLEQGSLIVATKARPGQTILLDQRRRKTNMLFTPTAAAMQRDPRFSPLMDAMGLTEYWRRRGIAPDYQKN